MSQILDLYCETGLTWPYLVFGLIVNYMYQIPKALFH